ncbi:hypothetical protein PR202_ga12271 [Eleusine coracana subsp. coracana]|uniref:NADH dehydrogenase subunit 2 n=1 Tax=Eleusine coracana subsp. coracana TaxID=191504 RepID=A0AAV5CB64_ELECO|nr:hypothetical protein PR202_ga12271 [Eleusine coracana subsp. coracana]
MNNKPAFLVSFNSSIFTMNSLSMTSWYSSAALINITPVVLVSFNSCITWLIFLSVTS